MGGGGSGAFTVSPLWRKGGRGKRKTGRQMRERIKTMKGGRKGDQKKENMHNEED